VTSLCHWCVAASVLSPLLVACSSSSSPTTPPKDAGSHEDVTSPHHDSGTTTHKDAPTSTGDSGISDAPRCEPACPNGYTCGTANGLAVCRAASGVPMFSHVFIIMEENTSLSTLNASISANAAPNFAMLQKEYATASGYHGVAHPSLPNYVALTSGGTQGIACDCAAAPGQDACSSANCSLLDSNECSCAQSATNIADQLEHASLSWMAYGEGMTTPCNLVFEAGTYDGGANYTCRHVPFLYYDNIQTNATRCSAHVVDYSQFSPDTAPDYTFIAPNLIDDMHNPFPATQGNITNGDTWIGPVIAKITASTAYTNGGVIFIVWDEDDDSGVGDPNSPIPLFVLSPYGKHGGYISPATFDHYSLLATIEDGFNLPRMGSAATPRPQTADTLAEFFDAP
jgi:phosphatidylinositol-3-phosphatase